MFKTLIWDQRTKTFRSKSPFLLFPDACNCNCHQTWLIPFSSCDGCLSCIVLNYGCFSSSNSIIIYLSIVSRCSEINWAAVDFWAICCCFFFFFLMADNWSSYFLYVTSYCYSVKYGCFCSYNSNCFYASPASINL